MNIHITSAHGEAHTELAAFDQALNKSGIADRNLLYLSSVIPPGTDLVIHSDAGIDAKDIPGSWGDRLYVVRAEKRTSVPGETVSTGIGWVYEPRTKKGLFVEHEGNSESEVSDLIERSLSGLMENRGIDPKDWTQGMQVHTATCHDKGQAVCSLTVAVYQASDWDNKPYYFE